MTLQKRLLTALALSAGIAVAWWLLFYVNTALDNDLGLLGTLGTALPCLVATTTACIELQGVQPDPFLVYSPLVFVVAIVQLGAFALAAGGLSYGTKIWIYRFFALQVIILQWWAFSSTNPLIPSPGRTWATARIMACELSPLERAARAEGIFPATGGLWSNVWPLILLVPGLTMLWFGAARGEVRRGLLITGGILAVLGATFFALIWTGKWAEWANVATPTTFWECLRNFTSTRIWHATFGIDQSSSGTVRQLGSVLIYLMGFGLAGLVGIFTGLILGGFRPFGRTMEIYVNALMATPRIAFIPLITVILGIFWEAKVFIIFLGAVMPIIVNTYAGVLNADGELVEMARSSGASRGQIFRRILLPGSLPFIVVGLRLGATIGLINTVVAELYVSVSGLGGLLSEYRGSFRMAHYSVVVVALALIGILVTQSLRYVESRMDRWRYSSR